MKTTTTILKKNFLQIVGFCLMAIYAANAQEQVKQQRTAPSGSTTQPIK